MFKDKCSNCGKYISKKSNFCSNCGTEIKDNVDYGFLGKEDLQGTDFKLPFGFKLLLKPLIKELNKQMKQLDEQMKNQMKDSSKKPVRKSFSIHIGMPNSKPLKITSGGEDLKINQYVNPEKEVKLPKVSLDDLKKYKGVPRVEPKTEIRRLSDRVIYEIYMPKVKSISQINLNLVESGFEIKGFSDKKVYSKSIEVSLPIKRVYIENEILFLEFKLN
jgi:hypothetical protein